MSICRMNGLAEWPCHRVLIYPVARFGVVGASILFRAPPSGSSSQVQERCALASMKFDLYKKLFLVGLSIISKAQHTTPPSDLELPTTSIVK